MTSFDECLPGEIFEEAAVLSVADLARMFAVEERHIVALAEEYRGALTRLAFSPAWARTAAVIAALLAIELFSATEQTIPFVYFQF